jgi:TRAP-type C4-dicarboxylate transport system permease small subunit
VTRLDAAASTLRRAADRLAAFGLCLLAINALATVADVLLRALLSAPIDRLSDVSSVIYFLSAACCVPAATAHRRHITIRAFEGRLPARPAALLEAFASAVLLAIWCVIALQLWLHAHGLQTVGQTLSQIAVPVAPFWYAVALSMSFNALLEALIGAGWLRAAVRGEVPEPAASASEAGAATLL